MLIQFELYSLIIYTFGVIVGYFAYRKKVAEGVMDILRHQSESFRLTLEKVRESHQGEVSLLNMKVQSKEKKENMNTLAAKLTLKESGKVQVSIAQIKEILGKLTLNDVARILSWKLSQKKGVTK